VGQRERSKNSGLSFFYGKESKIINSGQDVCTPRIVSAFKIVEFVSDTCI
jgi:hypothetical protein